MNKELSKYLGCGVLVNSGWIVALVFLSQDFFLDTLELSSWDFFVLMQVAGCATALLFKKTIIRASVRKSFALGLGLPFFALYAFIISMLLYKLVNGGLGGGDIGASFVYGPVFLVSFGYVIFPLGITSQFIMRWAGWGMRVPSGGADGQTGDA